MPENRGGPRAPTPGGLYPNRTDMATQPAQAIKGQPYGDRQASLTSQGIQPVAGAPVSGGAASSGLPLSGMAPGEVPTLTDPSANPSQPVTAGLPTGPGPGLEGMSMGSFGPQELSILRGLYRKYPQFEPIRAMIEQMEANL